MLINLCFDKREIENVCLEFVKCHYIDISTYFTINMYKTFAPAEFKRAYNAPTYEEQFKEILKKYEQYLHLKKNGEHQDVRGAVLEEYFEEHLNGWLPQGWLVKSDTEVWNDLWKKAKKNELADDQGEPVSDQKFLNVYEWLYPNLTVQQIREEEQYKDLVFNEYLVMLAKERPHYRAIWLAKQAKEQKEQRQEHIKKSMEKHRKKQTNLRKTKNAFKRLIQP